MSDGKDIIVHPGNRLRKWPLERGPQRSPHIRRIASKSPPHQPFPVVQHASASCRRWHRSNAAIADAAAGHSCGAASTKRSSCITGAVALTAYSAASSTSRANPRATSSLPDVLRASASCRLCWKRSNAAIAVSASGDGRPGRLARTAPRRSDPRSLDEARRRPTALRLERRRYVNRRRTHGPPPRGSFADRP